MAQNLEALVADEKIVGIQELDAVATPISPDYPEEDAQEVQKRIELRVSQSFFEAVRLLAETEGITKADLIRKAVSLYGRARVEQKQGNSIAFARVGGDNNIEITGILSESAPISPGYAEEEVQKRIELRVSQSFFEAVKILADTGGIPRADVIRKAVSLYAKARVEQKQGKFIVFVRVEVDGSIEIVDMLSVI